MTTPETPRTLRVGLVTMCSSRSVEGNVADATGFIREAAGLGATYVQTPEFTTLMELRSSKLFADTKPQENNPTVAHFSSLARELGIWLHLGSMGILVKPDKIANRSLLFAPDGAIAARYDKIHMFDAEPNPGEVFRESKNFQSGTSAVVTRLPVGDLGLSICYDLRFPGLYRTLAKAGAEIIAIPSAFVKQTGEAHWHALVRARAIETGAYVLAATQAGMHECGRPTYGHSIIVDPWGEVEAEGSVQPSVMVHDVQLEKVAAARRRMPSLEHDRPFELIRQGAGVPESAR